MNQTFDQNG